jgi:hypothetical protein
MPTADRLASIRSHLRHPGETVLLVAAACAILCLHIVAGVLMQRASPAGPGAQAELVLASHFD